MSDATITPSTLHASTLHYVPYTDDVEQRDDDEQQTINDIVDAMSKEGRTTEARYGRAVRTSHAKSHGLLKGELTVPDGLAAALRQGLFAQPRSYPVIARLATAPGEFLDDRKASTARGMALKVFGVNGPHLPGHESESTQDFVFGSGKVFPSAGPKAFLANAKLLALATPAPEIFKHAVSAASRATNAIFHAVGGNSPDLDFLGHPRLLPLAESYYSQAPFRYGDYIAKFRIAPTSPELVARIGEHLDMGHDPDALRTFVREHVRVHGAEYTFAVQLCTDLATMPIENVRAEWPEDESPFVPVARLRFPPQDGWTDARSAYVDERLSFSPSHTLVAHRPLGGLNRARLQVYDAMARTRRLHNSTVAAEPADSCDMPD